MRKQCFWVAMLILIGESYVLAQQAVTSATLSEFVEDSTGARIVGAKVLATNIDKNQSWTTTSDDQGRFQFLYLPVGPYQVQVSREEFATSTQRLTLSVGQAYATFGKPQGAFDPRQGQFGLRVNF